MLTNHNKFTFFIDQNKVLSKTAKDEHQQHVCLHFNFTICTYTNSNLKKILLMELAHEIQKANTIKLGYNEQLGTGQICSLYLGFIIAFNFFKQASLCMEATAMFQF